MNHIRKKICSILLIVTMLASSFAICSNETLTAKAALGIPIRTAEELAKLDYQKGNYYLANDIDMTEYGNWEPIDFSGTLDGNGHEIKNLQVTSSSWTSGLFSAISNATIKNLGLTNVNIVPYDARSAGALVGESIDSYIYNCYVTGRVLVNDSSLYTGYAGLVGESHNTIIENCYNAASVTVASEFSHTASIGGIIGEMDGGKLKYSYNIGTISCNIKEKINNVGGLVGNAKGQIYHCYSAGDVSTWNEERRYCGSLIGFVEHDSSLSSLYYYGSTSFWRNDNDSVLFDDKQKVLSYAEMRSAASYKGWDFEKVWTISPEKNNGLPTLLSMAPTTIQPIASVSSGKYTNAFQVTLSDGSDDAVIYYTLDGSTPTKNSYIYTGPFTISRTTRLNVMAIAPGCKASSVASYYYNFTLNRVKANIPSGKVRNKFKLKLSSPDSGVTIYYTLDGKTPTTKSRVYKKPILIKKNTVVKAIAVKGNAKSPVSSYTYRFVKK